jgi:AmpD protein
MVEEKGWLQGVEQCSSPNCNERPQQRDISLLVIHNISLPPGVFGGSCIREFFCNQLDCEAHPYFQQLREMQVSAHLLIERDGHLVQFVPFTARAWHAGQSSFQGVPDCNDYSIGIELEGTDQAAYTDAQYTSLAQVATTLMQLYPAINLDRLTGHSDIAPGRKTDPGPAFDWDYLRELIAGVQQRT